MNAVVIDTNVYSDALRGLEGAKHVLRSAQAILMSPVVIAELLSGFSLGRKAAENRTQLDAFLATSRITLLSITAETAERYASIFLLLKKSGTPLPSNDLWLAASAMEHGAKLASRDSHFKSIKGLLLIDTGEVPP